jgi:hypothetical protein
VAAAALVSLGVHLGAGVALAAVGGGTRRVRHYLAFLALLTLWLATLVVAATGGAAVAAVGERAGGLVAAVLPVAFLAFALAAGPDDRGGAGAGDRRGDTSRSRRRRWLAPLAVGTAPWDGPPWDRIAPAGAPWPLAWLPGPWHAVLWTAAPSCWRARRPPPSRDPISRRTRARVSSGPAGASDWRSSARWSRSARSCCGTAASGVP